VHHQILVPQKYTTRQVNRAETKRVEFRPNRYTSGSANLDNMIELGKAVILCATHVRKFDPKKARYRLHPDKNLRRVRGNCDVCQQFGFASFFLNEKDAEAEQRKVEKFRRAIEYGHIFRG
jgi:hypothetical protein